METLAARRSPPTHHAPRFPSRLRSHRNFFLSSTSSCAVEYWVQLAVRASAASTIAAAKYDSARSLPESTSVRYLRWAHKHNLLNPSPMPCLQLRLKNGSKRLVTPIDAVPVRFDRDTTNLPRCQRIPPKVVAFARAQCQPPAYGIASFALSR